jgi:hypothetical protein
MAFTAGKRHPVVCINIYVYVNKSDFAYKFGNYQLLMPFFVTIA